MKTSSFFLFRAVGLLCLLLMVSGCVNFEYTGQEFSSLPAGELPKFYASRAAVPAGVYAVIGRGVLTTGLQEEYEDIQDVLLEEGARRGADAVCIVSTRKESIGLFASDGEFDGPSDKLADPFNLTPAGAAVQVNMAGDPVNLPAEQTGRKVQVIRVLFFKNKEAVQKIISGREKQLEQLINKPAALPGSAK